MVEEEIIWLEEKVEEMKLRIYRERKQTKDWRMTLQPRARRRAPRYHFVFDGPECRLVPELKELEQCPIQLHKTEELRKHRVLRQRRASAGSASDIQSTSSSRSNGKRQLVLRFIFGEASTVCYLHLQYDIYVRMMNYSGTVLSLSPEKCSPRTVAHRN